jgi:hypothetical protein
MKKYFFAVLFGFLFLKDSKAQKKEDQANTIHKNSFGLQAGLTLLESPIVLYPAIHLSYAKTIAGKKKHRLAILYQLGGIFLPEIETKLLFAIAAQYKYISQKRFEAHVFFGLNNQLRILAYDRYQYEGNALKNKGKHLFQLGPTLGINLGYKIIKRENLSVVSFAGISLTQLNKNYQPNFISGYKPGIAIGFTINK